MPEGGRRGLAGNAALFVGVISSFRLFKPQLGALRLFTLVQAAVLGDATGAPSAFGMGCSPCTWVVLAPIPLALWNWSLRRRYAFAVQRLAEERYDPDEDG